MPEPSRSRASISLVAIIFAFLAGVVAGPVAYSVGIVLMMRSVVDYAMEGRQVKHPAQAESETPNGGAGDTKAVPTQADKAASEKSVTDCLDSLKVALPKGAFGGGNVFCKLRTPSGIVIEVTANASSLPNDNDLTQSDVRNYLNLRLAHEETWDRPGRDRIVIDALPTTRVYRLGKQYFNDDGSEKATLYVIGYIRSYAVLGAKRMYWVRCNATTDDDWCVIYVDVFARRTPNGDLVKPDGEPWLGAQNPCFIYIRPTFHDSSDGTELPGIIDTVESLTGTISGTQEFQDLFQQYCTNIAPKG